MQDLRQARTYRGVAVSDVKIWSALLLIISLGAVAQQPASIQDGSDKPGSRAAEPSAELPDAPSTVAFAQLFKSSYTHVRYDEFIPLSNLDKFHRWTAHVYSPYTYSSALMSAGWEQATGAWPTYGGGMQGFGKRFGATLANTEASGFFKVFLAPTILHQDPRYFAAPRGSVFSRAWYAATRVIVIRKDNGNETLNSSEVLGSLLFGSFENAYIPRVNRGFGLTMSAVTGALLSDALSNMQREFMPDITRLFRKHEPQTVRKIEQKIPKPIERIGVGNSNPGS